MRKALLQWILLTSISLALLAAPAGAADRLLRLDTAATEVTFLLGATGHDVHGVLRLAEGLIRFDAETGAASGEVVVDASLAETGNAKRDKTMHAKVLQSAAFPRMTFTVQSIEGALEPAGASEITLVGVVTLLGKEHPLRLPTKVSIDGGALSATTTFEVPFVAWGLHDPSTFILKVAKKVDVSIAARGTLEEAAAAATGAGT